jgi:hypothetical protein
MLYKDAKMFEYYLESIENPKIFEKWVEKIPEKGTTVAMPIVMVFFLTCYLYIGSQLVYFSAFYKSNKYS